MNKQQHLALVGPEPGTTRDRREALCSWRGLQVLLVDTAGYEAEFEDKNSSTLQQTNQQVSQALEDADLIMFLVDAKEGVTPTDELFARRLRSLLEKRQAAEAEAPKTHKHPDTTLNGCRRWPPEIILVLSKAEGTGVADCMADVYDLQLGHPVLVSTRTNQGLDALHERVLSAIKEQQERHRCLSAAPEQQDGTALTGYAASPREGPPGGSAAAEAWLEGLARRYGRGEHPALAHNEAPQGFPHLPWSLKKVTCETKEKTAQEETEEGLFLDPTKEPAREGEQEMPDTHTHQGNSELWPSAELEAEASAGPAECPEAPPECLDQVAENLFKADGVRDLNATIEEPIRLTFIGRPNAGKSSLINSILKENRLTASATPGTTTDSVCINFCFKKQKMVLTDTAGVTRGWKMRGDDLLQQASLQTMRNIRSADVCILCLDASRIQATGQISSHDLSLANLATEKEGRCMLVCVTKWDLVEDNNKDYVRSLILERLQTGLGHLKACPVVFTSSKQSQNLNSLLNKARSVYKPWCSRVPTGVLNEWLQDYTARWPPPWRLGSQCQVKYITQTQAKPPTFVAWSNVYAHFPTHYKRQLINAIREEFGLNGIPVRLVLRTTAMPKPGAKLTKAEALKWKRLGPHQHLAATKLSRKYLVKK
ncbi:small GTP-binding [Cyclospora cayetanensis]|uniref:Small GTP-binding n=1 Tax=Cyclospora cayetanensis TaxID=88456 RepID=A0A1D3CYK3_9EIME|nr:small GTP-binding [Cyclospora cayetanensis]